MANMWHYVRMAIIFHCNFTHNYKELCHRQLYQDLAGNALPAGVEIHHRDGDPRNNRAQNLEAMPRHTIGDFTDRLQERKKGAE